MAVEIFEMDSSGVLGEVKKLMGRIKPRPKATERELIERETDLRTARARFTELRAEREKLVARIRERDKANKDPKESNADAERANFIEGVLIRSLTARIGELERAARRDARAAANAKEIESDPTLKALVEAKEKHAGFVREESRIWTLLTVGTTDTDGKQIAPAPPGGSDERVELELALAETKKAKILAGRELKAAAEARRKYLADDKDRRQASVLKDWRGTAPDVLDAIKVALKEHERLEKLTSRLLSVGASVPMLPTVALSSLRLFVERTEAEARKYDAKKSRK